VASFQEALRQNPDFAEAHTNLGNALHDKGQLDEAIACYERVVQLRPASAEAYTNLGGALRERSKLDEATACYRKALELQQADAEAHNQLGVVLTQQGRSPEAVPCFRRAVDLRPDDPGYHTNLGVALGKQGQLNDALACYRRALHLKPDFVDAHVNLGGTLARGGELEEGLASLREAIRLKPDYASAHSNLCYTLHFSPRHDAQAIYEEHRRWNERHAEPLAVTLRPHANDRSPDRPLRIGYVSPDFARHPVGQFLLPLLEAHDHKRFVIFCYALVNAPDSMTQRCRGQADNWRDVVHFGDQQLADMIRADRIDLLVDLSLHSAGNRLLVFARKPAPVQVSYLGYCSTTGLAAMDYRLTDPYLDPPDQDEPYSERSVRLPETYWCYRPLSETPPVSPLPAAREGQITFGCLNNFAKVTVPTLAAWSRILQALPGARLLLHAHAGSHRERVRELFVQECISGDRVVFSDRAPLVEYYRLYERMDVALDPFPFGGGTTTCDALWMGVPVVSLAGQTAVGRAGLSILSNVGLSELVAHDPEQYVRLAVSLAQDLPRLSQLRGSLRERLQASPLMDAPRFARHIETAYRFMWQRWCAQE
jgi:predicted O-linked N-acetylglucosamine transferase (SPINDLY family)